MYIKFKECNKHKNYFSSFTNSIQKGKFCLKNENKVLFKKTSLARIKEE